MRDVKEVLQRVAAFLCEMRLTALNDFSASKVCFEKTECVERALNTIPAALLRVAYAREEGVGRGEKWGKNTGRAEQ